MDADKITFSFGKNWKSYVKTVTEAEIRSASSDIIEWLGEENICGKTILDIGSGSGIHSYAFHLLQAESVTSVDYDMASVEATEMFWKKAGRPPNWKVSQGSVLDDQFIQSLRQFDVVYSWGVLHHTGNMWQAIENAAARVAPKGTFFISLYVKGPNYQKDLALKQKYNNSGFLGKKLMEYVWIYNVMKKRAKMGENPLTWNVKKNRGMNVYHDIIDWLGGLPYEVSSPEETIRFMNERNFQIVKNTSKPEGWCDIYHFRKG